MLITLNTLFQKEKLLIMINFSFCNNIFISRLLHILTLIAEETSPSFIAVTLPGLHTRAILASWVFDTFFAQRSFPTDSASETVNQVMNCVHVDKCLQTVTYWGHTYSSCFWHVKHCTDCSSITINPLIFTSSMLSLFNKTKQYHVHVRL